MEIQKRKDQAAALKAERAEKRAAKAAGREAERATNEAPQSSSSPMKTRAALKAQESIKPPTSPESENDDDKAVDTDGNGQTSRTPSPPALPIDGVHASHGTSQAKDPPTPGGEIAGGGQTPLGNFQETAAPSPGGSESDSGPIPSVPGRPIMTDDELFGTVDDIGQDNPTDLQVDKFADERNGECMEVATTDRSIDAGRSKDPSNADDGSLSTDLVSQDPSSCMMNMY